MDVVSGVMGILVPKLLQLLQDEYQLQSDVKKEVKWLSDELGSIYAFLSKVSKVPWYKLNEQIKVWAREVRRASFDMEDALDTLLLSVKSHEHADESRLKHAMKKMGDLFTKAKPRHDIASAIKSIKQQVHEVAERRQRYRIDDHIRVRPAHTETDPRLSALYKQASQLVGIDEPRDAVIEMLSSVGRENHTSGKLKMVSIVGCGGLGKTTLAKAVYDKVNTLFDCHAFVPVGQNPDLKKVLRSILDELKLTNITSPHLNRNLSLGYTNEFDERQLINELRNYLEGKRYFIVVDDIWQTSTWRYISHAFVDGNCGSWILTTTRISEVSTQSGQVYRMEELSDENSRKLFYRITFGGEERRPSSDELDNEVCDTIIQKCRGVPLAIVTIAGALARKPTTEWSNLYNSIGFSPDDGDVDNMKKILSFSCYDLPSHLRTCFLYLCVFPEEFFIEKSNLIFRWMAEGFIHEENGKKLFDVGGSYLDELINRNVVIAKEGKESGLLQGCLVHDMLLRVIRQISVEEDFIVALEGEHMLSVAQENVRRLALQMLMVETNYKDAGRVRSFYATICGTKLIPPLCRFNVLRVLVLEYCIGMDEYSIEHIAKLLHLRYIGLSHTPVSKLPKQIGCLKFLQTLLLDDTGIKKLQASVRSLKQLMCLHVDENTRVPYWIGEMTSLVELEMYHEVVPHLFTREEPRVQAVEMHRAADNQCSTRRFVKQLGNLTNLRVLKTGITLKDKGQVRDFLESLRNLSNIQDISIGLPTAFIEVDVVLEPGFALSSSLCILELLNLEFSKLPEWINGHRLPNLRQLKVSVSNVEEKDLENLVTLPQLGDLTLGSIRVHRLKLTICGCGGFQNLRFLHLTVPLQFVQGAMPRLEVISFSFKVTDLKDANISFDLGLENLASLRSVTVTVDCAEACSAEVEEAEAVIRHAIGIHPNHPTLLFKRDDEDKMGPVDAGSRKIIRHFYKFLQDSMVDEQIKKFNEQIDILNNCNSSLYSQAQEMAHSLPEGHPSTAEIQWTSDSMPEMEMLRKKLADRFERINDTSEPNELMEHIKDQERLLVLYKVENKRMNSIKEELKSTLKEEGL